MLDCIIASLGPLETIAEQCMSRCTDIRSACDILSHSIQDTDAAGIEEKIVYIRMRERQRLYHEEKALSQLSELEFPWDNRQPSMAGDAYSIANKSIAVASCRIVGKIAYQLYSPTTRDVAILSQYLSFLVNSLPNLDENFIRNSMIMHLSPLEALRDHMQCLTSLLGEVIKILDASSVLISLDKHGSSSTMSKHKQTIQSNAIHTIDQVLKAVGVCQNKAGKTIQGFIKEYQDYIQSLEGRAMKLQLSPYLLVKTIQDDQERARRTCTIAVASIPLLEEIVRSGKAANSPTSGSNHPTPGKSQTIPLLHDISTSNILRSLNKLSNSLLDSLFVTNEKDFILGWKNHSSSVTNFQTNAAESPNELGNGFYAGSPPDNPLVSENPKTPTDNEDTNASSNFLIKELINCIATGSGSPKPLTSPLKISPLKIIKRVESPNSQQEVHHIAPFSLPGIQSITLISRTMTAPGSTRSKSIVKKEDLFLPLTLKNNVDATVPASYKDIFQGMSPKVMEHNSSQVASAWKTYDYIKSQQAIGDERLTLLRNIEGNSYLGNVDNFTRSVSPLGGNLNCLRPLQTYTLHTEPLTPISNNFFSSSSLNSDRSTLFTSHSPRETNKTNFLPPLLDSNTEGRAMISRGTEITTSFTLQMRRQDISEVNVLDGDSSISANSTKESSQQGVGDVDLRTPRKYSEPDKLTTKINKFNSYLDLLTPSGQGKDHRCEPIAATSPAMDQETDVNSMAHSEDYIGVTNDHYVSESRNPYGRNNWMDWRAADGKITYDKSHEARKQRLLANIEKPRAMTPGNLNRRSVSRGSVVSRSSVRMARSFVMNEGRKESSSRETNIPHCDPSAHDSMPRGKANVHILDPRNELATKDNSTGWSTPNEFPPGSPKQSHISVQSRSRILPDGIDQSMAPYPNYMGGYDAKDRSITFSIPPPSNLRSRESNRYSTEKLVNETRSIGSATSSPNSSHYSPASGNSSFLTSPSAGSIAPQDHRRSSVQSQESVLLNLPFAIPLSPFEKTDVITAHQDLESCGRPLTSPIPLKLIDFRQFPNMSDVVECDPSLPSVSSSSPSNHFPSNETSCAQHHAIQSSRNEPVAGSAETFSVPALRSIPRATTSGSMFYSEVMRRLKTPLTVNYQGQSNGSGIPHSQTRTSEVILPYINPAPNNRYLSHNIDSHALRLDSSQSGPNSGRMTLGVGGSSSPSFTSNTHINVGSSSISLFAKNHSQHPGTFESAIQLSNGFHGEKQPSTPSSITSSSRTIGGTLSRILHNRGGQFVGTRNRNVTFDGSISNNLPMTSPIQRPSTTHVIIRPPYGYPA